jgi:hypothetical protein
MKAACVLLISVLCLSGVGCDDEPDGPLSPSPTPAAPPPPPPPVVVSLALSGNFELSSVGETSQLTATATLSDGTSKEVSREVRWSVLDSRVLTISPDGLVTITSLGRTNVSATYASRYASTKVAATPPGTFVISGRVREPGQGGALDATVTDRATGRSANANVDGYFSLAALPSPQARVAVAKNDYEPREIEANAMAELDAPIQKIVRLTAGESVEPAPLAPNDLAYDVGGTLCQPCRMIRVVVPTTGDMEFILTWQAPPALTLYVEGMRLTGDSGRASGFMTISAPRELIVYVGASQVADHERFKLETTRP